MTSTPLSDTGACEAEEEEEEGTAAGSSMLKEIQNLFYMQDWALIRAASLDEDDEASSRFRIEKRSRRIRVSNESLDGSAWPSDGNI
jgi:hypothetical protein